MCHSRTRLPDLPRAQALVLRRPLPTRRPPSLSPPSLAPQPSRLLPHTSPMRHRSCGVATLTAGRCSSGLEAKPEGSVLSSFVLFLHICASFHVLTIPSSYHSIHFPFRVYMRPFLPHWSFSSFHIYTCRLSSLFPSSVNTFAFALTFTFLFTYIPTPLVPLRSLVPLLSYSC